MVCVSMQLVFQSTTFMSDSVERRRVLRQAAKDSLRASVPHGILGLGPE
jgi:hypothetical protein